jgi:hypothetical protein
MDTNYRQMANISESCISDRNCMRILYHNLYNTDRKQDLLDALHGNMPPREEIKPNLEALPIRNSSILVNNNKIVKPDTQYFAPLNAKLSPHEPIYSIEGSRIISNLN